MSNAHGTSTSLLLALSLLGVAGLTGCDTIDEATRARTAPGDDCVVDCDPEPKPEPDDCVMTHDRWAAESFATPEQGPVALGGDLCGMRYDEILTAPRDTPWMKVAQQYVTARVNVGHGASLPDEDRGRATPTSFRASHQALRQDLGDLGLGVAALLALGLAAWAVFDLLHASHGYFRVARFHGHLELMAGALLLLERRRG